MRLSSLQKQLEEIYGVRVEHAVDDFLITDPDLAQLLDTSKNARNIKEKLLVQQNGDNLDISLYLDSKVIQHLAENNPLQELHCGNLADFCLVLEGVSHFLYLAWNAFLDRNVTLLELEMQAEVDKYIASIFLFNKQNSKIVLSRLHNFLFTNPSFDRSLDQTALTRYKDANFFAAKYCWQLEEKFLKRGSGANLFEELRLFYRLSQEEKIGRIQRNTLI